MWGSPPYAGESTGKSAAQFQQKNPAFWRYTNTVWHERKEQQQQCTEAFPGL